MKKYKKCILATVLCGCMMLSVSCGTAPEAVEEPISVSAAEEPAAPEVLSFVDAHGNWYETEVSDGVRKHPYTWELLTWEGQWPSYEDEAYSSRYGIDVSKYQGEIDWEAVAGAGVEFVYIRIGYRGYGQEGVIRPDEKFYDNIQGAKAVGLDTGVYFFSQAVNEEEAAEEAAFVLEMLEGISLELPVVYDPERILNDEARTDSVTGEQFTKNTIVFCEKIREAGYEPMVYSNMLWEAFEFDMSVIEQYPVWYADYEPVPQTPYDLVCWQYSEEGHVPGIEGSVDLNLQFINKK